jgi:hypothetical protein
VLFLKNISGNLSKNKKIVLTVIGLLYIFFLLPPSGLSVGEFFGKTSIFSVITGVLLLWIK